jgi:AAT family amino acid transporter/D-serine/D-alanine/glycine transporter
MLLGVILNAVVPDQAFQYLLAICSLAALWTWGIIITTHIAYRRKVNAGELPASDFKLPGAKVLCPIVLTFLGGVVVLMGFDESTRIALFALPFWAGAPNRRLLPLEEIQPVPFHSRGPHPWAFKPS